MNYHSGHETSLSAADKRQLLEGFDPQYSPLVELGHALGPQALDTLLSKMGGQKPHIPSLENFWGGLKREVRDQRIRARFVGNNYEQLALEWGLSERQVREIVKGEQRSYKRPADPRVPVKLPVALHAALRNEAERMNVSTRDLAAALLEEALGNPLALGRAAQRLGAQMILETLEVAEA